MPADPTPDDFLRLESAGGLVDLSAGVKLRLSGPDAERYLNGQVTQDVRRIPDGGTLPACVCTHKGKLEALIHISRSGGAFYLSADAALRYFLPLRMDKYLIADDAVLEDVTEEYELVHALAPCPPPDGMGFASQRLGSPGHDVWMARGAASALTFSPQEAIEALRIARGIPAWEPELAHGILPPEARLEGPCIDYHKGCYTGQEVISRLRSVGKVNRLLHRFTAENGGRLEAGWEVFSGGETAGMLTSAAWHPVWQTGIGLGFAKRTATGPFTAGPLRVPVKLDGHEG
jgi:folate-binding protein YgfZ